MKKLLTLLLSLAMLLTLMSCSGKAQEAPAEEASGAPNEEVSQSESEAADIPVESDDPAETLEEPAEEVVEITVGGPVAYTLPLFEETYELSFFYVIRTGKNGSFPSHADPLNRFWTRACEQLNVSITWQEPGEAVAKEKYNLMMASGEITDLVSEVLVRNGNVGGYTGGYNKAIADEVYIDLFPYLEEFAPNYNYQLFANETNKKMAVTDDGYIPVFYPLSNELAYTNMGCAINADIFAATGLDTPPSTIDGWRDLLAIMQDNGVAYGLDVKSAGGMLDNLFANGIGANPLGGAFMVDNETGELVYGAVTDESRSYIELFREFYEAGYIDPDFLNNTTPENNKFFAGEIATKSTNVTQMETSLEQYGIDLIALPLIHRDGYGEGEVAVGSYTSLISASGGAVAVSTCCEDVEKAMRLMDWFYSEEGSLRLNYGWIEGETYDVINGEYVVNDFFSAKDEAGFSNKALYTTDGELGLIAPNLKYSIYTDKQKAAIDMWTADPEYPAAIYFGLPTAVALTADESERYLSGLTDINTYVETTVMRWYCMEEELTDESWNAFVDGCYGMGLDEIGAAYTAAYNRYLAK